MTDQHLKTFIHKLINRHCEMDGDWIVDINMSEVRADVEDRVIAMPEDQARRWLIELLVKAVDPTGDYE